MKQRILHEVIFSCHGCPYCKGRLNDIVFCGKTFRNDEGEINYIAKLENEFDDLIVDNDGRYFPDFCELEEAE